MSFQSQLEKNNRSLTELKNCLGSVEMETLLLSMKENWKPRTKLFSGHLIHGSKKGDSYSYTMYLDEVKNIWTSKEAAFRSYVMNNVSNAIVLQFTKIFNEI